jgi:hypothetical protein
VRESSTIVPREDKMGEEKMKAVWKVWDGRGRRLSYPRFLSMGLPIQYWLLEGAGRAGGRHPARAVVFPRVEWRAEGGERGCRRDGGSAVIEKWANSPCYSRMNHIPLER